MPRVLVLSIFLFFISPIPIGICQAQSDQTSVKGAGAAKTEYLDFFKQVYDKMNEEYYLPVSQKAYNAFIKKFNKKIYPELRAEHKTRDFIRWRSAAYLVDDLKDADDSFSAFYPPKPAQKYAQEALGQRIDLGITGKLIGNGFVVTMVEPHSNSYAAGLRIQDIILAIDQVAVAFLTQEKVDERLVPLAGTKVQLSYLAADTKEPKEVEVVSAEYFKQTVFMCPVDVPGVYCLEIQHFNQKTADDLLTYLMHIQKRGDDQGLILDFRNNPGGPPLAAREMSAFFLTPKEEFAYFQRRDRPKASLDVPEVPAKYRYNKPIVILLNEKSGSSSELFSGVMQRKARAFIMGVNSAGKVFLKSMFNFDDESMLLLVTSRGYFADGGTFSFKGITPDKIITDEKELIHLAAQHILSVVETKK